MNILDKELVSIVMPSYCSGRFISYAISSVINQTYENWEMIIVDDVSPDNSNDIINGYVKNDSRIKLICLVNNSGPAVARNRAIEEAKGRFVAFLDADDLWMPDKLEKQISFMQENDTALSYSSYELIDEAGNRLGFIKSPPEKLNYQDMLKENQIGCLTAIYDKKILGKCYMPLIRKRQDYGLWLSILKQIPNASKVQGVLAVYRVREDSISSGKLGLLKYNFKLFYNIEKMPFIKSVYYVGLNVISKITNINKN